MESELVRIEPLVTECPECQAPITRGQKKGVSGIELRRAEEQLRVLAAKGCARCDGRMMILTPAGEKVRLALVPLIDHCVRIEVGKQLRALGFAAELPAWVGSAYGDALAPGG